MRSFAIKIGFFLFAVLSPVMASGQDDTRAVKTWLVQKYDISVQMPGNERDRTMGARTTLSIRNVSGKPASSLTLRISPLAEISTIKINGSVTDFSKGEEKVGSAGSLQRISLRFPGAAADAVLNVDVDYKLTVKENSGLSELSPTHSGFLPLSFWYPTPTSWYFPRGADRAPFRLNVSVANGLTAISSGVSQNGVFEQKFGGQPFFVTGSWDAVTVNGVEVFMPKGTSQDGQKRAAELATLYSSARTFAAGILGTPPDEPMRIVAARRGAGFTGGGTVLVDESVFRRSKIDSQTAMSVAEAVAKLWIGNSIDSSGDAHGVVLEGLAKYIATEFLESSYGKDVADIERTRQRTAYAAVSKRDLPLVQVSPLDDFYYGEVANKGAMLWRLLAKRAGKTEFTNTLRSTIAGGSLSVPELRKAFSAYKDLLDYILEKPTDMDLLVGLPQVVGGETRVALRNTGGIDATVTVAAYLMNGQKMEAPTTIRALSFGEVAFKTAVKIDRVEVDADKLYPQTEYSDDIAPRETTDTDLLLAVKRSFDKQDFAAAEKTARTVLAALPRFDEVRVLLGRSLLGLGRTVEAEKEFKTVLDEKLPTSRSLAWANVGLAEIASRSNNNDAAYKFAMAAIFADSDYGASLAARNLRNKLGGSVAGDTEAKAFFADFDRAVASKRKADIDALVMPGEATRFAGGVAGSAEQWQTQIKQIDRLDANTLLVETNMSVKMLTKDPETGMAIYRLQRSPSGWKLLAVDMFEVR